jgi:hypothetical protein
MNDLRGLRNACWELPHYPAYYIQGPSITGVTHNSLEDKPCNACNACNAFAVKRRTTEPSPQNKNTPRWGLFNMSSHHDSAVLAKQYEHFIRRGPPLLRRLHRCSEASHGGDGQRRSWVAVWQICLEQGFANRGTEARALAGVETVA